MGLDDAADVVEDGHGPLPARQYVQRVRGFLHRLNSALMINQPISVSLPHRDTHSRDKLRTWSLLVMELRSVGRLLRPTRTSAFASRCWNRTSIVGKSSPTLHACDSHIIGKLMDRTS